MRRLDSLECERAMEEIRLLVDEGQLSIEQAQPVVAALFRRGMGDEAGELFDEHCRQICQRTVIVVEVTEAAELPDFDYEEDEPSELGFDPYAGQYLDDESIDPYED